MANNPSTNPEYNGQVNAPSAAYPYGSARNDTLPGDQTGTPRVASELNDVFGFLQALLTAAGIVPSGTPDTVTISQYLDSLRKLTPSSIAGVSEDFAGLSVVSGRHYSVRGWYQDQEFGGGIFVALPNSPKSLHDGGIFISPTVPPVSAQPGGTLADRRDAFINATGESDPTGNGVFARLSSDMPQLTWFGGVNLNDTVPVQAAKAAVQSNSNEATTYQWAGNMVIGDRPLPFSASIRDAFQVSRFIDGKTDCHAFADKTIIQNATDAGTYGTFDSETVVEGSHAQDHQFSFQDRAKYNGSGSLASWGNIIWPEMNGTGTVNSREDIEIKDISGAGGTVNTHIGLFIQDLTRANSNVAINLQQSSGFAVFAPGAGKWEIGGETKFKAPVIFGDTAAISGVPVTFASTGASNQRGFIATGPEAANFAVNGDFRCELVTNAATRLAVETAANLHAVRPGANNAQPLGNASFRWSEVFAANGTINTSDEREKQQVEELNEAEIRVAKKLKSLIRKYKFNKAVEEKGDAARNHIGVIAQQVQAAFESEGLDAFAYGVLCFDTWEETTEVVETDESHPDAYPVTTEVQKMETVKVPKRYVKIVEGAPVMVEELEEMEKPVTITANVKDEKGNPVFEKSLGKNEEGETIAIEIPMTFEVPVMEEVTTYYRKDVKPAGELYGVRYEQLLAFMIAGL